MRFLCPRRPSGVSGLAANRPWQPRSLPERENASCYSEVGEELAAFLTFPGFVHVGSAEKGFGVRGIEFQGVLCALEDLVHVFQLRPAQRQIQVEAQFDLLHFLLIFS